MRIHALDDFKEYRLYWDVTELGKDGNKLPTALQFTTSVKQSLYRPLGFQEFEVPRIATESAHESGNGCQPRAPAAFTPRNILDTHFCYRLSRPQGHSATRRVKSTINPNYPIGNRTRNLLACTAVIMASLLVYFSYIRFK